MNRILACFPDFGKLKSFYSGLCLTEATRLKPLEMTILPFMNASHGNQPSPAFENTGLLGVIQSQWNQVQNISLFLTESCVIPVLTTLTVPSMPGLLYAGSHRRPSSLSLKVVQTSFPTCSFRISMAKRYVLHSGCCLYSACPMDIKHYKASS